MNQSINQSIKYIHTLFLIRSFMARRCYGCCSKDPAAASAPRGSVGAGRIERPPNQKRAEPRSRRAIFDPNA